MNERIKQLESRAWGQVNRTNGLVRTEDLNKKFAELIVKECMDAVGDGPLERPAIQRIKAKFGVEYYEPIEKAFGVEE